MSTLCDTTLSLIMQIKFKFTRNLMYNTYTNSTETNSLLQYADLISWVYDGECNQMQSISTNSQQMSGHRGLDDLPNNLLPSHEGHENDNPIPHPDPSNDIDGELNFWLYTLLHRRKKPRISLFDNTKCWKGKLKCFLIINLFPPPLKIIFVIFLKPFLFIFCSYIFSTNYFSLLNFNDWLPIQPW